MFCAFASSFMLVFIELVDLDKIVIRFGYFW